MNKSLYNAAYRLNEAKSREAKCCARVLDLTEELTAAKKTRDIASQDVARAKIELCDEALSALEAAK